MMLWFQVDLCLLRELALWALYSFLVCSKLHCIYAFSAEINADSLKWIKTSTFVLCLDRSDENFHPFGKGTLLEKEGLQILHGFGTQAYGLNRWYDATIQVSQGINDEGKSTKIDKDQKIPSLNARAGPTQEDPAHLLVFYHRKSTLEAQKINL